MFQGPTKFDQGLTALQGSICQLQGGRVQQSKCHTAHDANGLEQIMQASKAVSHTAYWARTQKATQMDADAHALGMRTYESKEFRPAPVSDAETQGVTEFSINLGSSLMPRSPVREE